MINFATDINRRALDVTNRTFQENVSNNKQHVMELLQCDLATPLVSRLSNSIDIILFNPPYVPTSDDEVDNSGGIAAAWAGGLNGRRVIDRFVPQLAKLLNRPNGVAYMVTVDDNQPYQLAHELHHEYGLSMKPLLRRRAKNELLTIQKITWISETT
jgi:release factor glutamine methyltransferase